MNTWLSRCLLGGLLLATPALAQDEDSPFTYSDDESEQEAEEEPRRRRDPGDELREVAEQEGDEPTFQKMYRADDPNTGVAGEVLLGALMLDSSRGANVTADARLGMGLRFTWEFGRLIDMERLHESLWGDVRWTYGRLSDGTTLVSGKTNIHFFTVAPAFELKLASAFGVYAQVGAGTALQVTSLKVGEQVTEVNGLKPVLQYGVGLRARPRLSDTVSLALRLELVRFRRGYMDDTFIGGSVGTAF